MGFSLLRVLFESGRKRRMLNKILQNKIIAGTVAVLLLIIAVIVFVLIRDDSQEQTRSDLDVQIENDTEEDKTSNDKKGDVVIKEEESLKTPFEIVEDDSKTQTESVDAPISWDENYENSMADKTDITDKTDTSSTTEKTDSSSPSTDKDKDTNMPIEKTPDDEDVEYGSIF